MDTDQESNASDLPFADESGFYEENESDLEIDEEDVIEDENEEEDDDTENKMEEELEWIWSEKFIQDTIFSVNEVKGHTTINFTNNIKPIDIFHKFFTQDVYNLMIKQTNIYGKKKWLAQEQPSNWQEVSESTIRAFLGILIIMGLHRLPRINDYWCRNKIFYTEIISNTMPRKEFYRIFTSFHLSDNTKQKQFAKSSKKFKLFKVFDFIHLLKTNFQVNFILGTNICIDESMIKFKGKSSLKQYLPLKPIKRGYKVWCLADSLTGYLYNFDIYTGKQETRQGALGESVVLQLINNLNLVNHQLFFDNFFTSIPLLLQLKQKKIGATGTIRTNRKLFPTELLLKEKLKRGEYKYCSYNQISVVKWQDRKPVFVATNSFDPRETETIFRGEKDGSKQRIICPQMISKYNKFMGGVDSFDQRISCYSIDRKSKRNWFRIFIYFLQASLSNALICYNDLNEQHMDYIDFLSSISMSLIGDVSTRKRKGRPVHFSAQKLRRIQMTTKNKSLSTQLLAHMPVAGPKGRCGYCSTKARPIFSNIKCSFCGISLCVKQHKNCFLLFHENTA
ncbi:hypothetical protein I4U23_005296 [Adineta vaga]|nr:hypothetical protein I4U23_017001 [Adineta vaga]UJR18392.1 hypothetical protein I4U23_005296 [Adineta vaga]